MTELERLLGGEIIRFKKRFWMISISFCLLVFFLGIINCSKKSVSPQLDADARNLVKNSSFEQDGDPTTFGWEGISSSNISHGAPPMVGCGIWCLMISGGCVWSYASYLLDSVEDGGIYELSCWARKEQYGSGGAGISFFNKTTSEFSRSAPVVSSSWSKVSLIDTLHIAYGDSIFVMLQAGGGFAGSCSGFFDLVKVTRKN